MGLTHRGHERDDDLGEAGEVVAEWLEGDAGRGLDVQMRQLHSRGGSHKQQGWKGMSQANSGEKHTLHRAKKGAQYD